MDDRRVNGLHIRCPQHHIDDLIPYTNPPDTVDRAAELVYEALYGCTCLQVQPTDITVDPWSPL